MNIFNSHEFIYHFEIIFQNFASFIHIINYGSYFILFYKSLFFKYSYEKDLPTQFII
jgi:hypothetical protein